jgi:hypothetical protein
MTTEPKSEHAISVLFFGSGQNPIIGRLARVSISPIMEV